MRALSTTVLAIVFLAFGTAACASAGSGGESTRADRNTITAEQIEEVGASNLFQVIDRLQPRWLQVRPGGSGSFGGSGVGIVVYRNQTRIGGPDELRHMTPAGVRSIQYLDGPTASSTLPGLGSGYVHAAIVVHTR